MATSKDQRSGTGLLVLAGLALAVVCLFHPSSVFLTPARMDAYFGGATSGRWEWPAGSWSWQDEPFRYRLLFHGAVDLVAEAMAHVLPRDLRTYWLAYLTVTAATVVAAVWSAERFLEAAGIKRSARWLLLGLWVLMPPVHNAFVLPTQTKEDFLAYAILFLGLRAVLMGRSVEVLIWTAVGALTRETLMILPGIFLLAGQASLGWKAAALAIGLGIHAALRLGLGASGYEVVRAENFDTPWIVPVALASVLGFAWVALLPRLANACVRQGEWLRGCAPKDPVDRLMLALPAVLVVLLTTHIFMARVVEMRISFLTAPFALMALAPLASRMAALALSRSGLAAGLAFAMAAGALEISGVGPAMRAAVFPEIGPFATRVWWAEAHLQLALAALTLVAMLSRSPRP